MHSVNSRLLLAVAVIVQFHEYAIHCSTFNPNLRDLIVRPICDARYLAKYGNDFLNGPFDDGGFNGYATNFAYDPSEFMSLESASSEFLSGSFDESEEFLSHDYRDNQHSPFIDLHNWREKKSTRDTPQQESGLKASNLKNSRVGKIARSKPRKRGQHGKSKMNGRKRKNDRFYSSGITLKGLSVRNRKKNATGVALRSPFGWANYACDSTRRIVGGWVPQSIEKLPFMVFVDTGCGGSIISNKWILTAAHCIAEEAPAYVYVGSIDILSGCQYTVAAYHVHPDFSKIEFFSDVGLIHVRPSFVWSPAVKPVALPKARARYRMCGVIAGWGAKEYQSDTSMQLFMTYIPIVGKKKCWKFSLKKGEFCAGYSTGIADSCQGDSGGGFVVDNHVVGIVSYGDQCGKPRSPGVYVDVFHYIDWIKKITGIS